MTSGVDRGYDRISLDTLASGSIDKQTSRIRAAVVMEGRDPEGIEFYEDRSVSGAKVPFAERPGGSALLADLRPGDRVLVTKIDRMARNVVDLLTTVKRIKEAGATINFIDDKIDTAGPMGEFILTIIAAIAELEAKIVAERRRESLQMFKEEGRHAVGRAPWGFKSVENPNGRGLVMMPEPDKKDLLKSAIQRIMAGEPQAEIRKSLPGIGKSGFSKLLRNPRLAGMTPDGDGVVMVGGVPRVNPEAAVLTLSEWHALQRHLEGNPYQARGWKKQDGYGPALFCGTCGDRLYKNIKPTYPSYRCCSPSRQPGQRHAAITIEKADTYIEEKFLGEHGHRPYIVATWNEDESAKLEAISLAQTQVDELRRLMDAATKWEESVTGKQHVCSCSCHLVSPSPRRR